MKTLIYWILSLAMSISVNLAHGDDHSNSGNIVGFVYGLKVTDPAGVVEAMTEYWNSPIGKKNPATAILRRNVSNGDDPATHSIAVVYSSMAEMDQVNTLNQGTKEMQKFLSMMSEVATWTSEGMFVGTGITSGGSDIVPAPGRYTLATSIAVSDQAAYVPAWQEYSAAISRDSIATNLFFLNGMGREPTTHVVTMSANSMADLFQQDPEIQETYASFLNGVKDIRTIENRAIYVDLAVFGN